MLAKLMDVEGFFFSPSPLPVLSSHCHLYISPPAGKQIRSGKEEEGGGRSNHFFNLACEPYGVLSSTIFPDPTRQTQNTHISTYK